ncbi:TATE DNA transposon [Leptomonas pyrrhocoris]|uniref:TATE DNA transposon n=1 Tax=Leptomonas pyrrhocoris TaxID=157538 RepID=A0A0N0DQC8_LEPPY|nr:TATE DNA transposon [Leptomonas pyrrhocoris]KPA73092.1 TATE DNA transposon [Leptomonas pyrrhocoris]|eukprot:XP_015651531.1 TATE DNA transposon [Leptomonas pyrrhocoris]
MEYMTPQKFDFLRTSRTIKRTKLSLEDETRAIRMGKFERCPGEFNHRLHDGVHGVNVLTVPEMKGRRRMITEPHLNSVVRKAELPKLCSPGRLERRQGLRFAKYMLQIDFEAFYDAIPLPEETRNKFVFFTSREYYYRLKTLPTGARWSVAVGQSITNMIVDVVTGATIYTCIDNIMIAAREGQEEVFVATVRTVLQRIRQANLLTSPDRESLLAKTDTELLTLAQEEQVFLGERFWWNGTERLVSNSIKTISKLFLALQATRFTCRTFVSLLSLEMYALHTTRLNPAVFAHLLRAYRGVYRLVERGRPWDSELTFVDPRVNRLMRELGAKLVENGWWTIAPAVHVDYVDSRYDYISFTDASAEGWGAISRWKNGSAFKYPQRWVSDLETDDEEVHPAEGQDPLLFTAKHSAHAEPAAITRLLKLLLRRNPSPGQTSAVVTDHIAIVRAQRRQNGFGGIGRGYALNRLFQLPNALFHEQEINVVFFYMKGEGNPADDLSRHFGEDYSPQTIESPADNLGVPSVEHTYSPLCVRAGTEWPHYL